MTEKHDNVIVKPITFYAGLKINQSESFQDILGKTRKTVQNSRTVAVKVHSKTTTVARSSTCRVAKAGDFCDSWFARLHSKNLSL